MAKENVIYGYSLRKKNANVVFSILVIVFSIGVIFSIIPELRIIEMIVSLVLLLLCLLMVFRGESLQIKALQNQVKKAYKNKQILKYGVLVDDKQIAYYKKDNSTKSYPLNSIRRITYRNDLNGLFFSMSKLARYVFFIDLSNLNESQKEEVFTVLTNNLSDRDAQQELIKSIEESSNLETK